MLANRVESRLDDLDNLGHLTWGYFLVGQVGLVRKLTDYLDVTRFFRKQCWHLVAK